MSTQIPISALKNAFVGLDSQYPLADGRTARRIYLDSAASSLMFKPALQSTQAYLAHYANTHTTVHTSARITAAAMEWAYGRTLAFLHADPAHYLCSFLGSGTTAAVNRIAAGLAALRPERDMVLVSTLEHHSNDLPHRLHAGAVEHIPLEGEGAHKGRICLKSLEMLLEKHSGRVNYLAVAGVSNVTGVLNPIREIAELAHRHGAYLVVDGAQMSAHVPVHLEEDNIDFFVFSGHKTYAPGAPGVLVARRDLISAMPLHQAGGGMVSAVTKWGFDEADDLVDREQAGTPNIPGILTLACVLDTLAKVDMDKIFAEEKALVAWATDQLKQCRTITLYGDISQERVGAIAFNLGDIGHGLTAAILNDYHGIAVRNECFCAHPYVQEMLQEEFLALDSEGLDNEQLAALIEDRRGMVRASFGLYTLREDIEALVTALKDIEENIENYRPLYESLGDGSYRHKTFQPDPAALFSISAELDRHLGALVKG